MRTNSDNVYSGITGRMERHHEHNCIKIHGPDVQARPEFSGKDGNGWAAGGWWVVFVMHIIDFAKWKTKDK